MHRALLVNLIAAVGLAACATPPPAPVADTGWRWSAYSDAEGLAKLAFGTPDSDDVVLMLTCEASARGVEIVAPARRLGPMPLILTSGPDTLRLRAKAEPAEAFDGALVSARTTSAEPVLARFSQTGALSVRVDGEALPLAPAPAADAAAFLAHCRG